MTLAAERTITAAIRDRNVPALVEVARSLLAERERHLPQLRPDAVTSEPLGSCIVALTYAGLVARYALEAIAAGATDDPFEKSFLKASRETIDPAAQQYADQVSRCEQALGLPRSTRSLPHPVSKALQ